MMNYYIDMPQKQAIFTLMGGRIRIFRGRYNPTADAVWLAAFAPGNINTMLDVGIGTGGAGLCAIANNEKIHLTGIDISNEMLTECAKNVELNGYAVELINADISSWRTPRTFDTVITNPPYFRGTPARHNAHHNANLAIWVRRCVARVRPRGYFCIIVAADRIGEVIAEMHNHCGDITILPLFGAKHTAERVLIRGRVGTRGGVTLYSGLPMNYEPVLRDGLTIDTVLSKLGWK